MARTARAGRVGTKRFLTAEEIEVNRCRPPTDRKLRIVRSRFRSGTCELLAMLFRPSWDRRLILGRTCLTKVRLSNANELRLQSALRTAWRNVAPKRLAAERD